MTTFRFSLRPLVVGALAVMFGLLLALGTAPTAHAQELPDLDVPDLDDPDGGLLDLDDLLGDDLLDLDDLLGDLDLGDLSLDELLALLDLLDLLGTDTDPDPAPAPAPAPEPTPVAQAPAPAPAPAQVTRQPVGGVAAGAGGASDQGATTWPLLALGALTLAGAATAVRSRSVNA